MDDVTLLFGKPVFTNNVQYDKYAAYSLEKEYNKTRCMQFKHASQCEKNKNNVIRLDTIYSTVV